MRVLRGMRGMRVSTVFIKVIISSLGQKAQTTATALFVRTT